jgi:hypothetical protein
MEETASADTPGVALHRIDRRVIDPAQLGSADLDAPDARRIRARPCDHMLTLACPSHPSKLMRGDTYGIDTRGY